MEAPEPGLQARWTRPLQTPEPKLQRRWPTQIQTTAPHEEGQHDVLSEPVQRTERLEDQSYLPERENRVWQFIAVAVFTLVLAISTGWWGVTAVLP